jgi:hypothetical protein
MATTKRLGIIQTRGLGDIMISLPIALHYKEEGWEIYWPVVDAWVEQLTAQVPWVKWIPVQPDPGPFFYDIPMERLKNFKCDEILCLYQALTGHPEFSSEPWFQHTGFDQYKYIRAGRPFKDKLRLPECLFRDLEREQKLYAELAPPDDQPYVIVHLESSEQRVKYDTTMIPEGWATVEITNRGRVFDWLTLIEKAQAIIMTDSVFANIVDGLDMPNDKYFIPQHHIQLTPTFLSNWFWLPNPDLKTQASIFKAG